MPIDDTTVDLVRNSLVVALKIMFPILAAGVLIGLVISIFQSVTSIQEQTLSLVPKIFVMILVALALLPWILIRLADFAIEMFTLT
jgi:flagellar biosynthetic protein FliQ